MIYSIAILERCDVEAIGQAHEQANENNNAKRVAPTTVRCCKHYKMAHRGNFNLKGKL
jgi:hypothetical protein